MSRRWIEALVVAIVAVAIMLAVGRDLWTRHKYGDDTPAYRALSREPPAVAGYERGEAEEERLAADVNQIRDGD